MADQIRLIRNFGAHADAGYSVTREDIPVMLDFLDAILEYLYIAPTSSRECKGSWIESASEPCHLLKCFRITPFLRPLTRRAMASQSEHSRMAPLR